MTVLYVYVYPMNLVCASPRGSLKNIQQFRKIYIIHVITCSLMWSEFGRKLQKYVVGFFKKKFP